MSAAEADSDPAAYDSGESLRGSGHGEADTGSVSAAPATERPLTPEAAAVHGAASTASDQTLGTVTSRLPSLVFRTPERQGGTYHLAFTHDNTDGQPASPAFVHLVVLYPDTESQGVYDTARAAEGSELAVEPLKQEYADGFHTEHLRIRLPDDVLAEHEATGLRIQVSSAHEGNQFTLEIPAAHIEALLALRFPNGLPTNDDSRSGSEEAEELTHASDGTEAPARLQVSAFDSSAADGTVIGAFPHAYAEEPDTPQEALAGAEALAGVESPSFEPVYIAQTEPVTVREPQTHTRAHWGPWPVLAALGLLIVFLVWRFGLLQERQSTPAQTQAPAPQTLPQDSAVPAPPAPVTADSAASLASPAISTTPATPPSPPAAPPLMSGRRAAVGRFVEEWFATANRSPRNAMRFYAPKVDYYQRGYVAKAYIESDKMQLLRRWPVRDNRIEGSIIVTESGGESRVTFLFSYWLENGKQIRNGRARVLLSMQQRDGRYYIVRENAIALDAAGNAQSREFYWRHESGS